jgi:hypothetical protein
MTFTNYHSRYGYPRRIAYIAEVWWRVEHLPPWIAFDGRPLAPLARHAYRQRKAWERKGSTYVSPRAA